MPETMSPLRCKVTVGLEQTSGETDGAIAGGEALLLSEVKPVSRTFELSDASGTNVSGMG